MHRQIGEIVYSNFTQTSITITKLQLSLNNVQLKKKNLSGKDNRIKYLKEMVIKLGFHPSNSKAMEEIIKNKNHYIAALKK